jgi:hypothetical protein
LVNLLFLAYGVTSIRETGDADGSTWEARRRIQAGHIPGPRKALSPLPAGEATDPEMDKQLIQAGLLDPNQQVKEPFGSLLSALGNTDVMVDLSWTDAGETNGFSLYSLKTLEGSNPWAPTWVAETGSGGVVLRSPFTRQDLEVELQPVLEAGEVSTPKLEIGLTAPQAVILSVLMDRQKPQSGTEESSGPGFKPQACDAAWILDFLHEPEGPGKRQRYFSVPILALTPPMDWNPDNVLHVLNSLVRLGLCTQSNTGDYSLAEPMRNILAGFAGSGRLFWLSIRWSGGESDELTETEAEHIDFCSGGMNLVFSRSNGSFHLKTFSKIDIIGMIEKEIFPKVLSPVQHPVASVVQFAGIWKLTRRELTSYCTLALDGVG